MREPLYLRGNIWWCRIRNPHGGRHIKASTGCRDRKAAVLRWRELERQSIHHSDQAANDPPLKDALKSRLDERRNAGRAAGTLKMLIQKGRHLTRLLGSETPLSCIGAAEVDGFVTQRLKEKASRSTIYKELVTLRGALRLARRRGEYARSVEEIMPLDFAVSYKPKTRTLTLSEVKRVSAQLAPKRRAVFLFLLATGATYPSEVVSLRKSDVDTKNWMVLLRGTKRETRFRRVPIVSYAREWLAAAVPYVPFERWSNVRRDLQAACDAAKPKVTHFSPNDVRRTFATLLRAHGVEPQLIAPAMGHADSRMVERVYGRIPAEQLAKLLDDRVRGTAGVQSKAKRGKNAVG